MYISSPRAPRTSHTRSSSRTSPRQQERVHRFGGYRPNQPNHETAVHPPPLVPLNLHENRDTFNLDPTAAVLESGGETYQAPVERAGRRNFVGGFVGGLRKALQRNPNPRDPQAHAHGLVYPDAVVVSEAPAEEPHVYESIPRGEPEMQYAEPAQYAPPTHESHHRQESSSSTSETVHATQEQYDGTTVANHEPILPSEQFGSPVLVEPQPGSDYAKMDSPPRSEASFGSYLTRVHRFFQTLNNLPWVAPERVTVDYIPGKARQPDAVRPRRARRPVISWYNAHAPQNSVDLLGSSSPSTDYQPVHAAAQSPDVVYANNIPTPSAVAAASPPPMASTTRGMASAPAPNRVPRVPVPQYDAPPAAQYDTPAAAAGPGAYYAYTSPRYPNGYVPYEQQPGYDAHMVQMYTGSSAASTLPPQPPFPPEPVTPRRHRHQASAGPL
ncbi:hypothetical protein B0H10DRAFT_1944140 [Mycena sp. CBHHK59/15]|nr:hypothetical protein B0H10DRAFT_1944140 [Mycena sp. CBHHK59/15]